MFVFNSDRGGAQYTVVGLSVVWCKSRGMVTGGVRTDSWGAKV